jgi:hypothetical protein
LVDYPLVAGGGRFSIDRVSEAADLLLEFAGKLELVGHLEESALRLRWKLAADISTRHGGDVVVVHRDMSRAGNGERSRTGIGASSRNRPAPAINWLSNR